MLRPIGCVCALAVACTARTDLRLRAPGPGDQLPDDSTSTGNDGAGGDPASGDPASGDPASGDPASGDPASGDPGDPGPPVLTIIGSTNEPGASYLDLAIDWTRELAFVSDGALDGCFDVIDFSDETSPQLIATYNTTTTPATGCTKSRGLALFAGDTRLVVTCGEASTLEVWDVSARPDQTPPAHILTASTYHPRRLPLITEGMGGTTFYINHRNAAAYHAYDDEVPSLTDGGSWVGTDNQAAATVIGTAYMVTASWVADAPIQLIDLSDMSLADSFDMTNGLEANAFACAATSADQTRAFMGGWVSAFLAVGSSVAVARRFNNDGVYRDAVFFDGGAGTVYLYALRNDMVLDLFDATNINAPVLIGQSQIPVGASEAYSVRVNGTTRRLLIATTNGDFLVADLDSIDPATDTYPPL